MDRIVTERLVLRRAREDDLAEMHAVLSDRQAMRYWSTPPHTELAETREWLAKMIEDHGSARDDYLIELDGRVIGKAGCYRLPEIGYILHPDHWRRGYAREALSAVIAAIFARHDVPALTADVDPRNRASLDLLLKLGFQVTARARNTWCIAGEWCDSVYLGLPRAAYITE
jgi:ribosomal-protein-alanine N-acetyltransferase